jgi:hypothetical protein
MISDISLSRDETHLVPLIFLDTLYHFPSTLDLAERASQRYLADLHTFKPIAKDGKTELKDAKEFEDVYGEKLWEREEDMYDYLVKVSLPFSLLPSEQTLEVGMLIVFVLCIVASLGRAKPSSVRSTRRPSRSHRSSPIARVRPSLAPRRRD